MKILEVREGFIKFESDNQITLSSFIQVQGEVKCYVAQVVQVKRAGDYYIAYAKILFLFDGILQPYDKTLPSKESQISEFTYEILNKTLDTPVPVVVGQFKPNNINIPMDKNCFNKKLLVSSDDAKNLTTIISNIEKQFEHYGNVVIIDMLGNLGFSKSVAGQDFKLPLNTESLEFMYEDCLNDATSDSKNLIKEIFQDLSDYSKTVPFLPFNTLKTIVDDMVDKAHVFKLLVLKNKLARFDNQGYFAGNSIEAENLSRILSQKLSIIDLSKLDTLFQNRYLEVIYTQIEKNNSNTQVFVNISNAINKKNLKNIISNENVSSTILTHSKFKYINEIKTMFDNFIIEPSFVNNEVFKVYSTFLNAMQKGSYLIVGEGTNYIPLVSTVCEYEIEFENKNCVENNQPELESPVLDDEIQEEVNNEIEKEDIIEAEVENIEPEVQESIVEELAIETIDKKSEELIERVAEEVTTVTAPFNDIFAEEEDLDNINDEGLTSPTEQVSNPLDVELENSQVIISESSESELQNQEVEIVENVVASSAMIEEELTSVDKEVDVDVPVEIEDVESQSSNEELELLAAEDNKILEDDPVVIEEVSLSEDLSDNSELTNSEMIIEEDLSVEPISLSTTDTIEILSEDETEIIEIDSDISNLADEESLALSNDTTFVQDLVENQDETIDIGFNNEDFNQPELDVMSISENSAPFDEFGEIEELDISELQEDDIIVELETESEILLADEEMLDKEIVEDVDRVFTTMKDDSISDSDLDFIDELNDDNVIEETLSIEELEPLDNSGMVEELPEFSPDLSAEDNDDGFIETLPEVNDSSSKNDDKEILETRKASTPMVPIYDAEIPQEDVVSSDLIDQGDSVVHAKYGHGVVEKMIKYGTKTLYSINFDNIGRRLLDPTLTEIKKA